MAHGGAEVLIALLWGLLGPAMLAGLGGAIPGVVFGLPIGLGVGIGLVVAARRFKVFSREQPTWHGLSRAWYGLVPVAAMLTGGGIGGTLGFQLAACDALETTSRPLADGVASGAFELLRGLVKDRVIPPDVKTERELINWVMVPLEAELEKQVEAAHGKQWVLLKFGRPMLFATAAWLAEEIIHKAFEAAGEKTGLPPDQVRDAAIGILALGNAESEKAVADGLVQLLVKLASGLIGHGFLMSAVPLLVVVGALLLDTLAHFVWLKRRATAVP